LFSVGQQKNIAAACQYLYYFVSAFGLPGFHAGANLNKTIEKKQLCYKNTNTPRLN
jgi:hypothetical protein